MGHEHQPKPQQISNLPTPQQSNFSSLDSSESFSKPVAMAAKTPAESPLQWDHTRINPNPTPDDFQGEQLIAAAGVLVATVVIGGAAITIYIYFTLTSSSTITLRNSKRPGQDIQIVVNWLQDSLTTVVNKIIDAITQAQWFVQEQLESLQREIERQLGPLVAPLLPKPSTPLPTSPPSTSTANEPFGPPLPSTPFPQTSTIPANPPLAPLPPKIDILPPVSPPESDRDRKLAQQVARARKVEAEAKRKYNQEIAAIERRRTAEIRATMSREQARYTQLWQERIQWVPEADRPQVLQSAIAEYEQSQTAERLDRSNPVPQNAPLFSDIVGRKVTEYETARQPQVPYLSSSPVPTTQPPATVEGQVMPTVISQPRNPGDSVTVFPGQSTAPTSTNTGHGPSEPVQTQIGGFDQSHPPQPTHTAHGKPNIQLPSHTGNNQQEDLSHLFFPSELQPSGDSSIPDWLKEKFKAGREFNEQQKARYPYNEVYINAPEGGYYVLDSYNPATGEIVSRKLSQLASIEPQSAINYIREIERKYAPGRTIANVPSSGNLAGKELEGTKILEVPVQDSPIPQEVLDAATEADVAIKDVNGTIYNP